MKIDTESKIYRNSYIVAMLIGKIITKEERERKKEFEKDIIDEIFSLKFEEAINYLQDKKIISYEELEKISKESVSNYFWIKKATDLEITSKIQKKLISALEKGKTFHQFKKEINLDSMGIGENGSYFEGAFRTNIAIAQAKGQIDEQIQGIEQGYKYGLFDAILDGRETQTCHKLDGKVMLLEKWLEKGLYPPLHYRCRSRIIALDEEDINRMGLTIEEDVKGKAQGNFGSFGDSVEKLKELVREKEKRVGENKIKIKRLETIEQERKLPRITKEKENLIREKEEIIAFKATGTKNNIYMEEKTKKSLKLDGYNNKISVKKATEYIDNTLAKSFEKMGMRESDFGDLKTAIMIKENKFASYDPNKNIMYINPLYLGSESVYESVYKIGALRELANSDNILSNYIHELAHAYENKYYKKYHKGDNITEIKEKKLQSILAFIKEKGYNIEDKISVYAYKNKILLSELLAEAYTRKKLGKTNLLIEYILDLFELGDD